MSSTSSCSLTSSTCIQTARVCTSPAAGSHQDHQQQAASDQQHAAAADTLQYQTGGPSAQQASHLAAAVGLAGTAVAAVVGTAAVSVGAQKGCGYRGGRSQQGLPECWMTAAACKDMIT